MGEAQMHFFLEALSRIHRISKGLGFVHVEVQSVHGVRGLGRLPLEPASGGALDSTMCVCDHIFLVCLCAFAKAKNQSALCVNVPLELEARGVDRCLNCLTFGFFFWRHVKRCLNQWKVVARIAKQSRKSEKSH